LSEPALSLRPLCAESSSAAGEGLGATASRIEDWLLVEHGGYWPYDPLDATVFAGALREHLLAQLARLRNPRLLLVKRPGRFRPERIRVVYGSTPERGRRFYTIEVEQHRELLNRDFAAVLRGEAPAFGEPLEHPLLLVCTHGKRDRCCARYGQTLCQALHDSAHSSWVWQSSHVGGDRFAANLVCLPEGLYFGRVGRLQADSVLSAYVAGRIELEHYRGRSCYTFPVQAAELYVRRATALVGFHDLRLLARRRTAPDAWTVQLVAEVAGIVHEVEVVAELGVAAYLTCRAETPRRAPRWIVRSHRVWSYDGSS
jgi:hypothetical protein